MIHDITLLLDSSLAVWPGDTPFSYRASAWGTITVGALTLSCHTGTHVDAPRHFLPDGAPIAALDPAVFLGPCMVLDVVGASPIGPEHFVGKALAPRVLLKTLAWTDHTSFPTTIPTLTEAAVAALAAAGVRLLGLDLPSVDTIDSKTLPIHHALAAADIHILESVDLRAITPGDYELVALPLRLAAADGSPVRALLRETR